MKLFHVINQNTTLQAEPFTALLLKRLSIMEALAAIKFKVISIEDAPRELFIFNELEKLCQDNGYSIKKTQIILRIFMGCIQLAKCVQTACFHEWERLSVETVNAMGLTSARTIISAKLFSETLLKAIREYLNHVTNVMFETLKGLKITPELEQIIEPLACCFPKINRHFLEKTIGSMKKNLKTLTLCL